VYYFWKTFHQDRLPPVKMVAMPLRTEKMPAKKFISVDDYHKAFPLEIRKRLDLFRQTISSVLPDAREVISYNMPAFRMNKVVVYYAAFRDHVSLYPAPKGKKWEKVFEPYKTSGKGTLQFPYEKKVPVTLIKKIVRRRLGELAGNKTSSSGTNKVKTAEHFHNDGSLRARGQMRGKVMDGYWEWFRKDGLRMRSGHFRMGKQVGEWITYDKYGKIYKVTQMKER
jgi:uncharacterized protein YdhG (YjbR/CyaY superfamily)